MHIPKEYWMAAVVCRPEIQFVSIGKERKRRPWKKRGLKAFGGNLAKEKDCRNFWGRGVGEQAQASVVVAEASAILGKLISQQKKVEMISTGVQAASFSSAERRHYYTIFAHAHAISAMNGDKNRVTYHFRKGKKRPNYIFIEPQP